MVDIGYCIICTRWRYLSDMEPVSKDGITDRYYACKSCLAEVRSGGKGGATAPAKQGLGDLEKVLKVATEIAAILRREWGPPKERG